MVEFRTVEKKPGLLIADAHTHAFPDKVAASAIPRLEAGALWFECRAFFDGTVRGLLRTGCASILREGICPGNYVGQALDEGLVELAEKLWL